VEGNCRLPLCLIAKACSLNTRSPMSMSLKLFFKLLLQLLNILVASPFLFLAPPSPLLTCHLSSALTALLLSSLLCSASSLLPSPLTSLCSSPLLSVLCPVRWLIGLSLRRYTILSFRCDGNPCCLGRQDE
jgi:hypothetical protein